MRFDAQLCRLDFQGRSSFKPMSKANLLLLTSEIDEDVTLQIHPIYLRIRLISTGRQFLSGKAAQILRRDMLGETFHYAGTHGTAGH